MPPQQVSNSVRGFPEEATFDDRYALMTLKELDKLPVVKCLLPDVITGYTWKFLSRTDKGTQRWLIGRYDPLPARAGAPRSCIVAIRELIVLEVTD